ncbi:MAG: metal-dependent transcriptional regulator [Lentisphaerae bacterium]|nr:metal-dependent transcriptional regulator [Lentisphaerota bacterium]
MSKNVIDTKKLSAAMEDYLVIIHKFQQTKRFARVSDIASGLGVAKSAVTAALQNLFSSKLINYQPYEPVTLTREGKQQAQEIQLRHRVILNFLHEILAMDIQKAESIAHKMEHSIEALALEKFVCFLAFIHTRSDKGKMWRKDFQDFMQKGARNRTCKECINEYINRTRSEIEIAYPQ